MSSPKERSRPGVGGSESVQIKAGDSQRNDTTPALTGNRCQCVSCDLVFTGEEHFNRHRIGTFGIDRRCMTQAEMLNAGFIRKDDGCWCVASRAKRAAQHWCNGKSAPSGTRVMQPHRVAIDRPEIGDAR